MGTCSDVAIFMDFFIVRIDEEKNGVIYTTYQAKEIGGDVIISDNFLESLILGVSKYCYSNNSYYTLFIEECIKSFKGDS